MQSVPVYAPPWKASDSFVLLDKVWVMNSLVTKLHSAPLSHLQQGKITLTCFAGLQNEFLMQQLPWLQKLEVVFLGTKGNGENLYTLVDTFMYTYERMFKGHLWSMLCLVMVVYSSVWIDVDKCGEVCNIVANSSECKHVLLLLQILFSRLPLGQSHDSCHTAY